MSSISSYFISSVQVASDVTCVIACAWLAKQNKAQRAFFLINCIAFIALTFSDAYYNYLYRILKVDIIQSSELLETLPLTVFRVLQGYNWYSFLRQKNVNIISWLNLPYLLFAAIATCILAYFFYSTSSLSFISMLEDVVCIAFDMFIWVCTILCLGRAKNNPITLLALGCLMIVSSDLTFMCLFMFEMNNVISTTWPHIVWALGAFLMAVGFIKVRNIKEFTFFKPDSIHVKCSWWLLISSLIAFLLGFAMPCLFIQSKALYAIHDALWDIPISLMFTMTAATILSNKFSKAILSPINYFSHSIESFKAGNRLEIDFKNDINEFRILGEFIERSFNQISEQLDKEVKISAQVAHDVRSPLSALEIGIKLLPTTFDESKRVLLRDAVQHIKDITNNLERNGSYAKLNEEKHATQIAVILDSVISERRLTLCCPDLKINQVYEPDTYGYFTSVVPSTMKRILTNIINNSYEATGDKGGVINANLFEENGMCIISISDNGHGICKNNQKSIFKRGFTTKRNGNGLGLYHAKETIAEWGGSIELYSVEDRGTEVKIKVPLSAPPLWFVSRLSLLEDEVVVCIDDSHSVAQTWMERFNSFKKKPKLVYCASKAHFFNELNHLKYQTATYLVDFEFTGKSYQGYDFTNLIRMLGNPKNRIFLVTSRSGEAEIQGYCVSNSIHIIPKNFSVKIPIQIFNKAKEKIILTTLGNKNIASLDKSKWHVYTNMNDFIADIPYFEQHHKICIQDGVYHERVETELKKHGLYAERIEALKIFHHDYSI